MLQDLRRRPPREGQEVRREGGREGDMLRELGGRRLKHGTGQVHAPKETGLYKIYFKCGFWARECGKKEVKLDEFREEKTRRQEMAHLTLCFVDSSLNERFTQKGAFNFFGCPLKAKNEYSSRFRR